MIMRKNVIHFLIFAVSIVLYQNITNSASVEAIPYEVCSERRKRWTDKIITEASQFKLNPPANTTEAAANCLNGCDELDPFLSVRQEAEIIKNSAVNSSGENGDIPSICFYASSLHSINITKYRSYNCKNRNSEWPSSKNRTRPCLSKNYIDMTAKAFNKVTDCFNFSLNEKKQSFALFNHESHFMLNARSPGKARCYGQMTIDAIITINRNIYYRNHRSKFGNIYEEVINNCPELANKVIPPEITNRTKFSDTRLQTLMRRAPITCGTTQDPYSCLFYSLFNIKMNMQYFDDSYNEIPDYMGRKELPGNMQRDFQSPIRLNEMLVVKGKVKVKHSGKIKQVKMIFWDISEVYSAFAGKLEYDVNQLEIKKVSVFNKKTLRSIFVHYAHNGGSSVIKTHLTPFIESIKKDIAKKETCSKNKKCSKYRSSLMSGQSLDVSNLQEMFKPYAIMNKMKNVKELSEFTDKIETDLLILQNNNNQLRDHLDQIKNIPMSDSKKDDFVNQVKESCPASVY